MWLTQLDSTFIPGEDRIKLRSPLKYSSYKLKKIVEIPKDFDSDGLSIPRFLWLITGPPFQPNARKSAVLHDYLYRSGIYSRSMADKLFYEALLAEGCDSIKAYVFYVGIRMFGWFAWKRKRGKGLCCEN